MRKSEYCLSFERYSQRGTVLAIYAQNMADLKTKYEELLQMEDVMSHTIQTWSRYDFTAEVKF